MTEMDIVRNRNNFCNDFPKSFSWKSYLIIQYRIHKGNKTFKYAMFISSEVLFKCFSIITNETPFNNSISSTLATAKLLCPSFFHQPLYFCDI